MAHFVQFMHPGSEPEIVDGSSSKRWNHGEHQRCFLQSAGIALSKSNEEVRENLTLWGEWEGVASATDLIANEPGCPKYLFAPISASCPTTGTPQNTDPFVFGPEFLYCCCKQVKKNGTRTYLSKLERGDVILFGSALDRGFVLDTVFVVSSCTDYDPRKSVTQFRGTVPLEFIDATLQPLERAFQRRAQADTEGRPCGEESWVDEDETCSASSSPCEGISPQFRLYRGATHKKPVHGMFSFAPAKVYLEERLEFARPRPQVDLLSQGLTMGFRECLTPQSVWKQVVDSVLEQGLMLGVQFDLPKVSPAD